VQCKPSLAGECVSGWGGVGGGGLRLSQFHEAYHETSLGRNFVHMQDDRYMQDNSYR
jgi:hypothetical protein